MAATDTAEKCRLVTRSDFDGLVCAALLKELGILEEIKFVHPKDMQDGLVEITDRDITTNLPYVPGVRLAFDHHESETLRLEETAENHIIIPGAQSAARVVYDYFGGAERFKRVSESLMEAVDKADSALFSLDEIKTPSGWILLSFLMDPRTGLGRFRDFRISNYQLMMELIDACVERSVEEVLEMPDVVERVALYREHAVAAQAQLLETLDGAREPRGPRPARAGGDPPDQPLHDLRAAPQMQHLDPRAVGTQAAEHRLRDGQVDHRPVEQYGRRRADARLRRRWTRGGRYLPGAKHRCRARAG